MKLKKYNFAILISTKGKEDINKAVSQIKNTNIPIYIVSPEEINIENTTLIKDKGLGKPSALNLAIEKIPAQIIIFTDGDVYTNEQSINNIIKAFDENTGIVTTSVISLNNKNSILGFWSHFLVFAANNMRKEKYSKNEFFEATGYLMAVRKNLIEKIPENSLSEDGVISKMVHDKKYNIKYIDNAEVFVKFPQNFHDWIIQKKRSTGGYTQNLTERKNGSRSFFKEAKAGFFLFFSYPKNIKEFFYLFLLFLARIYLWIIIFIDLKIKRKNFSQIWLRVESTK